MKTHPFFIILFIIGILYSQSLKAIPAFARQFRISCTTCHSPAAPKLKAYGDDFAGDGFQLEDYESPRHFVETGDNRLSLMRDFPLALRMDGYVQYNTTGDGQSDLSAPYLLKLISGSEITDHLAYYFYFYMDEHGEIAGVEDAYLMFDELFNTELDIYLGQFQVSDPLFKRELRLTFEDYHLYTSQIGLSDINMKYDKGVMFTYGLPTGTDVILEVVNGNGLTEAGNAKLFDKDKYKNLLGRVSQDIGDFLRIGAVGYWGKEKIGSETNQVTNEVYIVGSDATLSFGEMLEFNVQYLYREDADILTGDVIVPRMNDVKTHGGLAEVVFSPNGEKSTWYAVGLYNYVDSDYNFADYQTVTLHLGYLLRRNVRLVGEFTQGLINEPDSDFSRFSIGFVSAF